MAVEAISETTDCGGVESVHAGMTMLIACGDEKKPPEEATPANDAKISRKRIPAET